MSPPGGLRTHKMSTTLITLPAELRELVYSHLLPPNTLEGSAVCSESGECEFEVPESEVGKLRDWYTMLRTCKAIKKEIGDWFAISIVSRYHLEGIEMCEGDCVECYNEDHGLASQVHYDSLAWMVNTPGALRVTDMTFISPDEHESDAAGRFDWTELSQYMRLPLFQNISMLEVRLIDVSPDCGALEFWLAVMEEDSDDDDEYWKWDQAATSVLGLDEILGLHYITQEHPQLKYVDSEVCEESHTKTIRMSSIPGNIDLMDRLAQVFTKGCKQVLQEKWEWEKLKEKLTTIHLPEDMLDHLKWDEVWEMDCLYGGLDPNRLWFTDMEF